MTTVYVAGFPKSPQPTKKPKAEQFGSMVRVEIQKKPMRKSSVPDVTFPRIDTLTHLKSIRLSWVVTEFIIQKLHFLPFDKCARLLKDGSVQLTKRDLEAYWEAIRKDGTINWLVLQHPAGLDQQLSNATKVTLKPGKKNRHERLSLLGPIQFAMMIAVTFDHWFSGEHSETLFDGLFNPDKEPPLHFIRKLRPYDRMKRFVKQYFDASRSAGASNK